MQRSRLQQFEHAYVVVTAGLWIYTFTFRDKGTAIPVLAMTVAWAVWMLWLRDRIFPKHPLP